jgi:hypothetical protein
MLRRSLPVGEPMRLRLAVVAAWLGVAGVATLVAATLAEGAPAALKNCGKPAPEARPAEHRGTLPVLSGGDDGFQIRLDDSRDLEITPVDLTAYGLPRSAILNVQFGGDGQLHSSETWRISPVDDGLALRWRRTGDRIRVCVVVNPDRVTDLHPGRFVGSVVIYGDVQPLSMPVVVTLRSSRLNAMGFAFIGVLLGLVAKVLTEAARRRRPGTGSWEALRSYMGQLTFPVMLILAGVAGYLGFVQLYASDLDWGSGGSDSARLLAACFIAQLGGLAGIDLIRQATGNVPVPTAASLEGS